MSKIKNSLSRKKMYLNSPDKLFIADSEINYYKLSKASCVHESLNVNSNIINQKFEIDQNQGYYSNNPIEYMEINRNAMGIINSVDEERPGNTFKRTNSFVPTQIHYKHGLIHCDDDRPAIDGHVSLMKLTTDHINPFCKSEIPNIASILNRAYVRLNHPVSGDCKFYYNRITYYSHKMKAYFKNGMIHREFEDGPALIIDSFSGSYDTDFENFELKLYAQNGIIIVDSELALNNAEAAKKKWDSLLSEENKFVLSLIERFNYNSEYIKKCDQIAESLPEELSFLQYS